MGILDDAIREHLDLKRQHGAQENEVQILEDEAFGPPSRPGEPDFPERPPTGEHATGEVVEAPAQEAPAEAPVAEAPAAAVEPPPEIEEPPPPPEPEDAHSPFFDQASEDSSTLHQPTVEHPAPEPEPEDLAAEDLAAEPPAAEPPPAPEPEPASGEGEFEIGEIELELDDEFEEFREPVSDESDEQAAVALDADDEAEQPEVAEPEGETLLEETPDFLRDTPEDERLWFEQGKPQDFDFDDDEDDGEPEEEPRDKK